MSAERKELEQLNDLTQFVEHASCAMSVLGDLLKAIPEEKLTAGTTESLGCLLQILGDGMMRRSLDGYKFIQEIHRGT